MNAALRRLLLLTPLVVVAVLAAVVWTVIKDSDPDAFDQVRFENRAVISRPLPPLSGGVDIEISDLLADQGPVVIVNFFASWCVPCRAEHPYLMAQAEASGLPIVGIGYKDSPAELAAFLQELGNPYAAILVDADGRAGIDWGLSGVPETYIVKNGTQLVGKLKGPLVGETNINRFEALRDAAMAEVTAE